MMMNLMMMNLGNKFVIKHDPGVRKQFLILNGEVVLGFVTKGKKFAACTSYTEVTTSVDCKVWRFKDILLKDHFEHNFTRLYQALVM